MLIFASDPARTPLPNPQFFILICIRFIEPISFTLLFPFVYFMVKDFDLTEDSRMIGYYAGLVSAAFAVGEFISGVPWGILSDRIGRKPVMLMGLIGTTISMFLFGMSKSLPWAMVTRFMAGSLNGNIGVLKTMVSEMTDRTNRGEAFGYVAMTFGIGLIIGPVLGGFLTNPATNFPWLFGNVQFLKDYPYFLPCGLSSFFCALGFVFAYIYLEETLGCQDQPAAPPLESNSSTPLLGPSSAGPSAVSSYGTFPSDKNDQIPVAESGISGGEPEKIRPTISKGTWLVIFSYMGLSLLLVMSDELFPFWAGTAIDEGGLGYKSEDIGALNSMMGVILILIQLTLFAPLQQRFGALKLMQYSFIMYIPLFAMLPLAKIFVDNGHPILAWLTLIALFGLKTLFTILSFTSYNVLLPESCESKAMLGQINGISQSLGSLMRGIGPYLCGVFWSWSLTNGRHFPLDYHFTFYVISVVSFITFIITSRIQTDMVAF